MRRSAHERTGVRPDESSPGPVRPRSSQSSLTRPGPEPEPRPAPPPDPHPNPRIQQQRQPGSDRDRPALPSRSPARNARRGHGPDRGRPPESRHRRPGAERGHDRGPRGQRDRRRGRGPPGQCDRGHGRDPVSPGRWGPRATATRLSGGTAGADGTRPGTAGCSRGCGQHGPGRHQRGRRRCRPGTRRRAYRLSKARRARRITRSAALAARTPTSFHKLLQISLNP